MNLHNLVFILAVATLLPCSILGRPSVEEKEQEIANTDANVYNEKITDDYDYEDVVDNNLAEVGKEGNQDEGADEDSNEQIEDEKQGNHEVIGEKSVEEQEEGKEGDVKKGTDEKSEEENEQHGFEGNRRSGGYEGYSNEGEHTQDNGNQNGKGNNNRLINGMRTLIDSSTDLLGTVNDLGITFAEAAKVIKNAGGILVSPEQQPANNNWNLGRPTRKPNQNASGNNQRTQRPPNTGGNGKTRPIQRPLNPHGNGNNNQRTQRPPVRSSNGNSRPIKQPANPNGNVRNQRTQRPPVPGSKGNMRPTQRPSRPKEYGKPQIRGQKGTNKKIRKARNENTKKFRKYKG